MAVVRKSCTYCGGLPVSQSWPAADIRCCDDWDCHVRLRDDYQKAHDLDLVGCAYSAVCRNVAVDVVNMGPVGDVLVCREHKDFYDSLSWEVVKS